MINGGRNEKKKKTVEEPLARLFHHLLYKLQFFFYVSLLFRSESVFLIRKRVLILLWFPSPHFLPFLASCGNYTESTELSKCFARQGIKIPIRKETRFKRPSDRFYGANALNSLNDSPSKKGHAEQAKIDEKITSPDDDDEEEMSQVQHQFVEVDHQDYPEEGSSGTNKKTSPVPYKRLSISSYLTQSNEDDK